MAAAPPTCSICDNPLPTGGPELKHRPFCSSRCKLVDLSRWLGEEYRVAGPIVGDGAELDPEAAEALEGFDLLGALNEEDLS